MQSSFQRFLFALIFLVAIFLSLYCIWSSRMSSTAWDEEESPEITWTPLPDGSYPLCDPDILRTAMKTAKPPMEEPAKTSKRAKVTVVAILAGGNPPFQELITNWNNMSQFFLVPHSIDYILFYDTSNVQNSRMMELITTLDLKKRDNSTEISGSYSTTDGLNFIIKGREFPLPYFLQKNPQVLNQQDWMRCADQHFKLDYTLYSGAVFAHHIPLDPILDPYDYVFKIDTDISFMKAFPTDPIQLIQKQGCILVHAAIMYGREHSSCEAEAYAAISQFATQANISLASGQYQWCQKTDYFYGNFVGGATRYFRSQRNKILNRWLYECWENGYFRHRWGDQASHPQYLCTWSDIPSIANDSRICDWTKWRGDVFDHDT